MRWGRACPWPEDCGHRAAAVAGPEVDGVVRWPLCQLTVSYRRCPVHSCERQERELPDMPRLAGFAGEVVGGYRLKRLAAAAALYDFVPPQEPGHYWVVWSWARHFADKRVPFAVVARGNCLALVKEPVTILRG